jgi:hypothetical protein
MDKLLNQLKGLEISLHQPEVRTNPDRLKQLLHPQFVEVGYSGITYDLDSIVACLLSEPQTDSGIWSQDYECHRLAHDVAQLVYLSATMDKAGGLSRHAKRSSIWVSDAGDWKMKFHQATPVAGLEKSNALTSS